MAKIIGMDRMMIHGGVDQSETSFDDTYILVGINKSLNASYNNSNGSSNALNTINNDSLKA